MFCSLGIQAVGASQGCDQVGRSDIVVFGFDRNPAQLELVKQGKVMGSIAQGCYNMGWWACLGLYIEHNNLWETGISLHLSVPVCPTLTRVM